MTLIALLALSWATISAGDGYPAMLGGSSESIFFSDTLSDWVSYAQQMSIVTVVAEEAVPPHQAVLKRGRGYIGRIVTLRIVETIWVAEGAVALTGELRVVDKGWWFTGNRLIPQTSDGGPHMAVNAEYLIPLVTSPQFVSPHVESTTIPLMPSAILPLKDRTVDPSHRPRNPVAMQLVGTTVEEIQTMFATTTPTPLALKYWHLEPVARVRAVVEEMSKTVVVP